MAKKRKKKKTNKKLREAHQRMKCESKAERQKKYEWVFMNGKQVRVKREPTIDGMSGDEFIEQNADPIWLHQNGLWECIPMEEGECRLSEKDDDVPF